MLNLLKKFKRMDMKNTKKKSKKIKSQHQVNDAELRKVLTCNYNKQQNGKTDATQNAISSN